MATEIELSMPERVRRLFDYLGIRRAHLAGGMREVVGVASANPERVASVTMVCTHQPMLVEPLRPFAPRLLLIHGDQGPSARIVPRALPALPGATDALLPDYFDVAWGDPAAERGAEVSAALLAFIAGIGEAAWVSPPTNGSEEGEVAGISYRATGDGPPLVLFPLTLSASQWEPLLAELGQHYRVVSVGGAHIGVVALLEHRAHVAYGTVMREFVEDVAPRSDERVLEVGCGSGVVTRWLAQRTGGSSPIVGVDINRYLLREAAGLARSTGLADAIVFQEGNAEALPFADDSFDVTLSCTVMEEVNADRMWAEMLRVTRPGGRVGVMVRTVDMRWWVNLPLPPELKAKAEAGLGSGVAAEGCADASLYRRFMAAGLTQLKMGPKLGITHAGPGFAATRASFEVGQRAALTAEEAQAWDAAAAQADAEGTFMWGHPFHCAVGTKP